MRDVLYGRLPDNGDIIGERIKFWLRIGALFSALKDFVLSDDIIDASCGRIIPYH